MGSGFGQSADCLDEQRHPGQEGPGCCANETRWLQEGVRSGEEAGWKHEYSEVDEDVGVSIWRELNVLGRVSE